jgi:phosphatidylserine/phosphatidylglycerophosphate/cardiolipin synthase-like enzyme
MDHALLSRGVRVLVQPEDGTEPVAALIAGARASVRVKMFTFTEPALIDALVQAQARGVAVRVMLNPARSSGSRANDETLATLRAAGVDAQWSNPAFAVTHEKSMVVDDRMALVATFNFVDKYFSLTRDYGLILEAPEAAGEIAACFDADWRREAFTPPEASALLWSNRNARRVMSAFIDAAQATLAIQHPKFVDAVILDRLLAARARGIMVRVLCGGRHGISDYDLLDTFASLRIMRRADIRVRKQRGLRLHAKLLVADGARALVGSMNIDRSAFDLRRELGAVIADRDAVSRLRVRFDADWEEGHRYDAPDPLLAHALPEDDHPPDPDLMHE